MSNYDLTKIVIQSLKNKEITELQAIRKLIELGYNREESEELI